MRFGPIRLLTIISSGLGVVGFSILFAGVSVGDRILLDRATVIDHLYPKILTLSASSMGQSDIFKDDADTTIGSYYTQNRRVVPLSSIPEQMQDAFISAEDAGLYSEPGISFSGIFRSFIRDLHHSGRPAGASTIPQQVVKNMVMDDPVMTLQAKLDEVILAIQAVQLYGPKTLLWFYLNDIYLGHGSYGVDVAAQNYYHKSLTELDLAQTAMLAGLPKSPVQYDPLLHPKAAIARRSYVLGQMLENGYINKIEYNSALVEPLFPVNSSSAAIPANPEEGVSGAIRTLDQNNESSLDMISDSTKAISGQAIGWAIDQARRDFLQKDINHNGDQIELTIDPGLQKLGQAALQWGVLRWSMKHEGWSGALPVASNGNPVVPADVPEWLSPVKVISASPEHLTVMAYESSPPQNQTIGLKNITHTVDLSGIILKKGHHWPKPGDYVLAGTPWPGDPWQVGDTTDINGSLVAVDPKSGRVLSLIGGFNYTPSQFDRAVYGLRQPGSAFKPFIYLAGAELGMKPDTEIIDAPISISQGPGLPWWQPHNDDNQNKGVVTFETALAMSLNDAATRLLYEIGLNDVSNVSKAFGLYDKVDNYTAALGSQVITNFALTGAYAGLANNGFYTPPYLISSIKDRNGKTIYTSAIGSQAAPADAVGTVDISMSGTVDFGTASSLSSLQREFPGIGGKTGTAQDYQNTVFEGYIPGQLALGVFIGYDQPKSLGYEAYAAEVAVPIWRWFVDHDKDLIKSTEANSKLQSKEIQGSSVTSTQSNTMTYSSK